MQMEQIQPKLCPLCGSNLITQILCDTLLSAHFRGMQCPSEGVVAYHCESSHVFLVLRNDFSWGQHAVRRFSFFLINFSSQSSARQAISE